MELTSKQRAQLRGLANNIDTILIVGKEGIGDNLVQQANEALEARELIKGRVLETSLMSAREAAEALAPRTRSEVVQVIGTKCVLYRPSHKKDLKNKIVLVADKKKRGAAPCRGRCAAIIFFFPKTQTSRRGGNGPMRTSAPTKYALHIGPGLAPAAHKGENPVSKCATTRRTVL